MKRMLLTLAAAAGLAALVGPAHADPGGFSPPPRSQGGSSGPAFGEFNDPNTLLGAAGAAGKPTERYGLLPSLRKTFRIGGAGCDKPGCGPQGCGNGTCGRAGCAKCAANAGYGPMAGYPPVMQGTLAFPMNPYVRSPRDFFMYEPGH